MTPTLKNELKERTRSLQRFSTALLVDEFWAAISAIPNVWAALRHLSFYLDGSTVRVWAEIETNRRDIRRALYLAGAAVNAKFAEHGCRIWMLVVEEDTELPVPANYTNIPLPVDPADDPAQFAPVVITEIKPQ